jgi:hypothetical protein
MAESLIWPAITFSRPLGGWCIAAGIGLDEPGVSGRRNWLLSVSCDDVAPVSSLLNAKALICVEGLTPLLIAAGIGPDQPNVLASRSVRPRVSYNDVSPVTSLPHALPPVNIQSAEALAKRAVIPPMKYVYLIQSTP